MSGCNVSGGNAERGKGEGKEDELVAVARDIFGRQDLLLMDLAEQIADTGRKGTYSEKLYQVHAGEGNHTERPKPKLLYHRKFKTGELMIPLIKKHSEAYMERLLEQVEKVVGALDKKNKAVAANYLNGETAVR